MGMALQIALFLASVSIVVLVAVLVPVFLGLHKQVTELNADVKLLVQDSRTMVQNVNQLTTQAQQQIDEVDQSLRILRGWLARADRLAQQAGDLIEGPIFTGTRILTGLGKLFQAWLQKDVETAGKNP
jgi:uncharacterized protein YoxC